MVIKGSRKEENYNENQNVFQDFLNDMVKVHKKMKATRWCNRINTLFLLHRKVTQQSLY